MEGLLLMNASVEYNIRNVEIVASSGLKNIILRVFFIMLLIWSLNSRKTDPEIDQSLKTARHEYVFLTCWFPASSTSILYTHQVNR